MADIAPPPSPPSDPIAAWAAAEAEAASPPPGPPPAAPARGGFGGRVLAAAAVLACAAGGVYGGLSARDKLNPPPEPAAEEVAEEAPKVELPDGSRAARIDLLIRSGDFAGALKLCRESPKNPFPDEAARAYRQGLCLEGLGEWAAADAQYAAAERDPHAGTWARALLGRARCALENGSADLAQAFVDRVLLRSGHPQCRGANVTEEAVFVRARAVLAGLGRQPPTDPLDADALAWPVLRNTPDRYLDWLPPEPGSASPSPDPGGDLIEVAADDSAPGRRLITARLTRRPALDVLTQIAAAADLELQATEDVSALLADLAGPVELDRTPLDLALGALTDRAGVSWAIRGDALALGRAARPPEPDAVAGALRRALGVAPGHPAANPARVALANLDAQAGRLGSAAQGYKAALEVSTNPPEAVCAAYNWGLLELREGRRAAARARFLEVLDRGPNGKWAEFGWCWIARTYLDGDDLVSARQSYQTALAGFNREATSAAGLGVIACDLLRGDDEAAADLLREVKFSTRERHADLVRFYELLLQHRTRPTESRRERLVEAMTAADHARAVGPAGAYLAGRVYLELGQPNRTTALYEREVETARGPLALRMLWDNAERFDRLDQRRLARARYAAVSAADPSGLGGAAELKLAALDVRDGNGAEAVRRCRALLGRADVPRAEVLSVMGSGYELLKQYRAAAECFAGRAP